MNTPYDLPDYHALIRRIREIDRAGGDSTLARLVTADFLQEHGEEWRAALIRSQCDGVKGFSVDNIPYRVRDREQSSGQWNAFACPKGSTDHFRVVLPSPPDSTVVWSIRRGFAHRLSAPPRLVASPRPGHLPPAPGAGGGNNGGLGSGSPGNSVGSATVRQSIVQNRHAGNHLLRSVGHCLRATENDRE